MNENTDNGKKYNGKKFIPTLINSILIFAVFYAVANYYKNNIINSAINRFSKNDENVNLVYYQMAYILYYVIICIGIVIVLIHIGFNIASIVTILGALGLAIGLAMQNSLQNIIGGIFISLLNLFNIGDYIKLVPLGNVNPIYGRVVKFNLCYTTILDLKTNTITSIPNLAVYGNVLSNYGKVKPIL